MRTIALSALSVVLFSGCLYNDTDYDHANAEVFEALRVTIPVDSLPADNKSTTTITYQLPIAVDTVNTRFTLRCSNCRFQQSGTNELVTNVAKLTDSRDHRFTEVTIVATGVSGECIITTGLSVYQRRDILKMHKADATSISLSAQPFYIRNDTVREINLTATLNSATGIASKDHEVTFDAIPPGRGFFQKTKVRSDAVGSAATIFVFTDTTYSGDIMFSATVPSPSVAPGTFVLPVLE